MDYITNMMFPGGSLSFKMSSKGINKSKIQEMMRDNSTQLDMEQIKKVFEYFLEVSVKDCNTQLAQQVKGDKSNVEGVKSDFQKALATSKKMTSAEFFQAKVNAQREGILVNIDNLEKLLLGNLALTIDDREYFMNKLGFYRQDLTIWDSLHPDEQLFFVAKSMSDYEKSHMSYYQDLENPNSSNKSGIIGFLKSKFSKSNAKRNETSDKTQAVPADENSQESGDRQM